MWPKGLKKYLKVKTEVNSKSAPKQNNGNYLLKTEQSHCSDNKR